jgi:RecA-family ATPase
LIIFDSLIQFHTGSEQDSSETRRYLDQYRRLAHLGPGIVLPHHTGKGEGAKQYRGSSDIKASVDQAFCLEALSDGGGSTTRELRLSPFAF